MKGPGLTLLFPGSTDRLHRRPTAKIVTEQGVLWEIVQVLDEDGGYRWGRIEEIEFRRITPARKRWRLRKPKPYSRRRVTVRFGRKGYPHG